MLVREWRIFGLEVACSDDDGSLAISPPLLAALARRLAVPADEISPSDVTLVRRSLDARPRRPRRAAPPPPPAVRWSYVVDVTLAREVARRLRPQPGRQLPAARERARDSSVRRGGGEARRVVVVGAGPCGLFAALELARAGHRVTLCERGKPVEERGKSIGALIKRGEVDPESNFCYGEGGAGTWSDGKLTTRIGRNSAEVRHVLETLVRFGAPARILVDGAPHLGTDNLVRLLKAFRRELQSLGACLRWDARVERLLVADGRVRGVALASGESVGADAVLVAAGHSARELYAELLRCGATLVPKDFAVGFRVEHPQQSINEAQYGELAALCLARGQGPLPPAAYRLATTVADGRDVARRAARGVYSFCMCPGGQIVPTALDAAHLCINGMSYSNRGSRWANSAVVVSVGASFGDTEGVSLERVGGHAELAGLAFQEAMEERAAAMGGGKVVCPVQRVSDFLEGRLSEGVLPESSYRIGVVSAPLHELYPEPLTHALREGLRKFAASMPGFDSEEALLHGVETRTSSPVQVARDNVTLEATTLRGLYPAGEGAGYAGGIVSAAVDGVRVARAVVDAMSKLDSSEPSVA
ncbi:hypothetical protein AB1Y20_017812 [Prymnesium parvum]|uniref:Uncharacterized protein n=1 Tax=Prymnesium parvum TaxID=97485 RepID=A0AB34JMP0_PRYPA